MPKAREQVRAKAILSRRKGIQESGCVEEYEVFVEAVCEGAVPPKRINAEGSDSILADLDVPKSFMSPEAPSFNSFMIYKYRHEFFLSLI